MKEKKLTDEEIVNALECCAKDISCIWDSKCPLRNSKDCHVILTRGVLDLINRQKKDYIELDLECQNLQTELDKELAEHEEFVKRAKEEIESLKSKSSFKNSWKNKFFKAQEEVERLNQGYDMLNYESARKEEYIETLKKQVDDLKLDLENWKKAAYGYKYAEEQAVKDTAKEIYTQMLEWIPIGEDYSTFIDNFEMWLKERYGLEVE
jgi:chromosome segregation ATPase